MERAFILLFLYLSLSVSKLNLQGQSCTSIFSEKSKEKADSFLVQSIKCDNVFQCKVIEDQ